MNANSTLHIIKFATFNSKNVTKKTPPSKDELHQVSIASRWISDSNFHKVAQRLGQRETFEKIMATCPELEYNKVRVTLRKYGKPFLKFWTF